MDTTPEFEDSYYDFELYPENLMDNHFYPSLLRSYTRRLQLAADKLFIKSHLHSDVPFRDWNAQTKDFEKQNIFNDEKLRVRLGDSYHVDAQGLESGALATKPDPKCRFIFLQADHSRAPLRLSKEMLARILSFHQVMPQFLEFLFLFGERTGPNDLRYSGFREITRLSAPAPYQIMPNVGRSGQRYQLCYNLKTVSMTRGGNSLSEHQYSIRQAAICHHFDIVSGATLWIVVQGNRILKERIEDVTDPDGRDEDRSFETPEQCFRSSLAIHMDVACWASEEWRQYTQYLEMILDQETQGAVLGTRIAGYSRKEYTPEDLQRVQLWEEKSKEVEVILGQNVSVLSALREYYLSLSTNTNFPIGRTHESDILAFAAQMSDAISESNTQLARVKLLSDITMQRKQLILQHLQSQAAEEVKVLSFLSQKEAIAMRIITVATLLYLPATFVSTFFSTDVVKYQPSGDGPNGVDSDMTSFSVLAMSRWLQVTVPLTVVTVLLAYCAYKRAQAKVDWRFFNGVIMGQPSTLPLYEPKRRQKHP